jgi:hypothetical protein
MTLRSATVARRAVSIQTAEAQGSVSGENQNLCYDGFCHVRYPAAASHIVLAELAFVENTHIYNVDCGPLHGVDYGMAQLEPGLVAVRHSGDLP